MDQTVFLAVLLAAACHAGWNALLKLKLEPLLAVSLISFACAVVTAPFIPFVALPVPASWPYLVASLILHLGYYVTLAEAYRQGDLGQVYPIARGTAPLLTAILATTWLGERLGLVGWAGVAILTTAILLLALRGGRDHRAFDPRSVGFALATSAIIACYTVVDGSGARLAGSPFPYIVWLMFLDGLMMLAFGWWWAGGGGLVVAMRGQWPMLLAGGTLSTIAYAIAIWAMTVAPIALVAALRETSVLFAAVIGIVWLGEPVRALRVAAACLAVVGALLIRFR